MMSKAIATMALVLLTVNAASAVDLFNCELRVVKSGAGDVLTRERTTIEIARGTEPGQMKPFDLVLNQQASATLAGFYANCGTWTRNEDNLIRYSCVLVDQKTGIKLQSGGLMPLLTKLNLTGLRNQDGSQREARLDCYNTMKK